MTDISLTTGSFMDEEGSVATVQLSSQGSLAPDSTKTTPTVQELIAVINAVFVEQGWTDPPTWRGWQNVIVSP